MNEVIAMASLIGVISVGTIIIGFRYMRTKSKVKEERLELERKDVAQ
ncbi:hypothetical protein KQI86_03990 [Clostridium sp. MSJ-11]|uniref:Uncharacterized protein n=1 Tax=Clostridium mobile TaxID=2841512 RepID=A0ABS6EE92_9CLOT|nr:hypothetical protein [Clostridium mobile]MBU5483477.1 hypothetical protein [Clostridium mobile]